MHVCKHEMHIAYCTQLRNAAIPISNSVGTTVGMRAIFKYFLSRPSFSTVAAQTPLKKPVLRQSRPRKPHLLICPLIAFGLGTWQVYRKQWKEDLLKKIASRIASEPLDISELFNNVDNLDEYEYYPFKLTGKFLYDKEVYLGPVSKVDPNEKSVKSTGMFSEPNVTSGYNVISAFQIADTDDIVLVNRGWVPMDLEDWKKRNEEHIFDNVDIIGFFRPQEKCSVFMPKNHKFEDTWPYRNVLEMSSYINTIPFYFDLKTDLGLRNNPVPNQTRVALYNEHLTYIVTWYGLAVGTLLFWLFNV